MIRACSTFSRDPLKAFLFEAKSFAGTIGIVRGNRYIARVNLSESAALLLEKPVNRNRQPGRYGTRIPCHVVPGEYAVTNSIPLHFGPQTEIRAQILPFWTRHLSTILRGGGRQ